MKLGKVVSKKDLYEVESGVFVPSFTKTTTEKLPSGIYSVQQNQSTGQLLLSPKEMVFEKFITLPDMTTNLILEDLSTFWNPETKAKYEQLDLIYKRGILMHGLPGVGKSATISKVCEKFIEQDGIILFNPSPAMLYFIVQDIQAIDPTRKLLVIWEEFECHLDDSTFLSILDGELQLSNVAYIATTNYIDQIPQRIKNRPSRFAQVIEVGFPTFQDRLEYLTNKLKSVNISEELILEIAELTEGFVLDQVKDVVISHFVFNYSLEESIAKIKTFSYDENEEENYEDEEEYDDSEETFKYPPQAVRASRLLQKRLGWISPKD